MDNKKSYKSKTRRVLKYIFWTVFSLLLFVSIGISAAIYIVFTPERITPIVMRYANEYINAQVDCESVELTFYSTFPNFGVRLRNGSIVTPNDSLFACPQDTLLSFNDCSVSFNAMALYNENQLKINHVRMERPVVYLYASPDGRTNWNVLPQDGSAADSTTALPAITVRGIRIADANVIYDDRKHSLFIATDSMQLRARGALTNVDLLLKVQSLTTLYEEKSYTTKLPFTLKARMTSDESYQRFVVERSTLSIGFVDFDLDGTASRDTANNSTDIDMKFKLHASSFADMVDAIPRHILDLREFGFAGTLDFSGSINGTLGTDRYPACAVSLQLSDGAIFDPQYPDKPIVQKMDIDCNAEIDLMNNKPSYLDVKNIYLRNSFTQLHLSGTFNNILVKPFVDVKIDGGIDFDAFGQLLLDNAATAGGKITIDLGGKFFIDDILSFNFGKVDATGSIDVNNVKFDYPEMGIDLFTPLAKLRFGSNVTDSIRGRSVASLLRANVDIDSLRFKWKDKMAFRAGRLFAYFRTADSKDTTKIVEMSAFARLNNLQLATADSIRLRATKISASAKLAPFVKNPLLPEWTARISLDTIRGRAPEVAGFIDSTVLTLKIYPREVRQRRQLTTEDSLRRKLFLDSMTIANRNSSFVEFRLSEGETRQFLSQWDVSGSFTSKDMRMVTPYFPLRMRMSRSAVRFTPDSLSIKHTRLQAGASNMTLNGTIDGIRRALLYNGRIKANIVAKIDSIDCNEIIRTLAAGSTYSSRTDEQQDSISNIMLTDDLPEPTTNDTLFGLLVVPRNIDVELDASMKRVKYGRIDVEQADGKIIVRNRSIRIPDMKIKSNIGNADFSLVYKAPTIKGAYTGIDVHLERVQLREMINAIPIFDSLTPMMRSFEGQAECHIIAVTELDSLSNIIIPKTTASCYINGKNMVLLDGETFAAIAKKMYFKNKNRNIIDSISVDMMLEDGKISVFPFVLSIDRYVAAVGGTQNLDMSFQYHISILKWPIPLIKIGLNIWGNPDDIHYSIVSRKYENLLTPVKEKSLQSVVFNLRQQVYDGLRKSIDDILNESPEILNRRLIPDTNNDTIQSLFKIDSVSKIDSVN